MCSLHSDIGLLSRVTAVTHCQSVLKIRGNHSQANLPNLLLSSHWSHSESGAWGVGAGRRATVNPFLVARNVLLTLPSLSPTRVLLPGVTHINKMRLSLVHKQRKVVFFDLRMERCELVL